MRWNTLLHVVLLAIAASGCTSVTSFRSKAEQCSVAPPGNSRARAVCADHFVEKHGDRDIVYLELSDMGLFYDRRQLASALAAATPRGDEQVDVIVYIHGWLHSAKYSDADVSDFTRHVVPYFESTRSRLGGKRRTVGVYVGWRGSPLQVLGTLSFYDRKTAADHIARGSVREFFARLQGIKAVHPGKVTIVAAGHSFGGLILFNALAGVITETLVREQYQGPNAREASGLDLVLLLNPAFEAIRYEPLFQSALYPAGPASSASRFPRKPLLIAITSKSDTATSFFFPAGRTFNSLFQHEGRTDQDPDGIPWGDWVEKLSNKNTVGHLPRYRTHQLVAKRTGDVVELECQPLVHPLIDEPNTFPLWNFTADKSAMDGHNDIYDRELWGYLVSMATNPTCASTRIPAAAIEQE